MSVTARINARQIPDHMQSRIDLDLNRTLSTIYSVSERSTPVTVEDENKESLDNADPSYSEILHEMRDKNTTLERQMLTATKSMTDMVPILSHLVAVQKELSPDRYQPVSGDSQSPEYCTPVQSPISTPVNQSPFSNGIDLNPFPSEGEGGSDPPSETLVRGDINRANES